MFLTYDEKIHLPVAWRATARIPTPSEVEWSDLGRSPRFLAGWYILPGFAVAALLLAIIVL
jgi:hypothetical protein